MCNEQRLMIATVDTWERVGRVVLTEQHPVTGEWVAVGVTAAGKPVALCELTTAEGCLRFLRGLTAEAIEAIAGPQGQ